MQEGKTWGSIVLIIRFPVGFEGVQKRFLTVPQPPSPAHLPLFPPPPCVILPPLYPHPPTPFHPLCLLLRAPAHLPLSHPPPPLESVGVGEENTK